MSFVGTTPTADPQPTIYFELSWAILSSIGLMNVFYGGLVVGITSLSPITIVPIVVSAACAIANGMCYYSSYANYQQIPSLVAGIIADFMWLIQEAGLSFYSYQILSSVLVYRERRIFLASFWSVITMISLLRGTILVTRAIDNFHHTALYQKRINALHIGYFVAIALVEAISSVFLLRVFAAAKKASTIISSRPSLFRHLTRSTEIRLATLSLIGITRAITYSSQNAAQRATSVASQVDRFIYTLECLFPVLLMIDILGSKLVSAEHVVHSLPTQHSPTARRPTSGFGERFSIANSGKSSFTRLDKRGRLSNSSVWSRGPTGPTHPMPTVKTSITAGGPRGSSEEWMVDAGQHENPNMHGVPQTPSGKYGGISVSKEVQFEHIELYRRNP